MAVREMVAAPHVREEDEQHDRHERGAEQQRGRDVVDGEVDEFGGPEQGRMQRHPGRVDRRPENPQRLLGARGHDLRIAAELARNDDHHAPLAVHSSLAEPGLRALDHAAEVAEAEHGALAFTHGRLRERVGRQHLPFGLHGDALIRPVDDPRPADAGRLARRLGHLGDADAVGAEPLGIHLDLHLTDFPAEHRDLRHSRRRQQPRPEDAVHEGPLLHRAVRLRGDPDDEDGAGRGGERGEHRRVHRRGQLARGLHQSLRERLTRAVDVHPLAKHRGNDRQALDGLGTDRGDSLNAVDGRFERTSDEDLYLLRG